MRLGNNQINHGNHPTNFNFSTSLKMITRVSSPPHNAAILTVIAPQTLIAKHFVNEVKNNLALSGASLRGERSGHGSEGESERERSLMIPREKPR